MGTDPCVYVTLGVNIVSIFPFSIISVIYTLIRLKLTLHARRHPFFFRLPLLRPRLLIKSVPGSNPISALQLIISNCQHIPFARPCFGSLIVVSFEFKGKKISGAGKIIIPGRESSRNIKMYTKSLSLRLNR